MRLGLGTVGCLLGNSVVIAGDQKRQLSCHGVAHLVRQGTPMLLHGHASAACRRVCEDALGYPASKRGSLVPTGARQILTRGSVAFAKYPARMPADQTNKKHVKSAA
jgi:hypothetical protein